jgi:hypothetical protein
MTSRDLLVEAFCNLSPEEARAAWHAIAAFVENEEADGDPDHPGEHYAAAQSLCDRLDVAMIETHSGTVPA